MGEAAIEGFGPPALGVGSRAFGRVIDDDEIQVRGGGHFGGPRLAQGDDSDLALNPPAKTFVFAKRRGSKRPDGGFGQGRERWTGVSGRGEAPDQLNADPENLLTVGPAD